MPRAAGPAKAKGAAKATRRASGPRKGSGRRAAEALALIQATPGVTIPELAVKMGIKKTYLYTVLPDLERAGLVKKDGRGWHPASAAAATA
jgi:DNA-binding IclR family transcriptional regulator